MSNDNARVLLLCAGLVLVLMGSAVNPLGCAIPSGGGGQIGGGFVDGAEGDANPTVPTNTNRNLVSATITKADLSTVAHSSRGVVQSDGEQMTSHDNTNDNEIQWDISWIWEGTYYMGAQSSNWWMLYVDSTTTPPTLYYTYEDTTTYTQEDNANGRSGFLNIISYTTDLIVAAFSFVASDSTSTPISGNKVTVEGTTFIPR